MFSGTYKLCICTCTGKCVCKCMHTRWRISFQVTCISAWWVINFTTWEVNSIPKRCENCKNLNLKMRYKLKQCTILCDKFFLSVIWQLASQIFLAATLDVFWQENTVVWDHWWPYCVCVGACVCHAHVNWWRESLLFLSGEPSLISWSGACALLWLFHKYKEGSSILVHVN